MSEIIFPSEILIPAEIDWENSIADALVSSGVRIFFTDDNLSTVTDVVTGSSGVAADITDNELGVVSNGYRMGAIITGLTSEQQTSVTDNPYQLFKTQEKLEQEYGLKLTTASEQITFPLVGAWTGTLTYSDGTTITESGTGDFTLDGTTEIFIKAFAATDTVNSYFWEFNQSTGSTVLDHYHDSVSTLANTTDVNWQEIIQVNTYTVGAGKDYSDLTSAFTATNNNLTATTELVLYDDITTSQNNGGYHKYGKFLVRGVKPLGEHNYTELVKIHVSTGTAFATFGNSTANLSDITFKDLYFQSSTGSAIATRTDINETTSAINCVMEALSDNQPVRGLDSIDNCMVVLNPSITSDLSIFTGSSAINSIALGGRFGFSVGSVTNCISALRNSTYTSKDYNTSLGSNNISEDSTASTEGIGTGSVDFTGAFVDSENGDYKVNQDWADTNLVGQGWNGTDIASWAWNNPEGTEQPITLATTEQLTQSETVSVMGIGFTNAIVSESITQSQLVNVNETAQLNAIVSEQKTESTLQAIATINNVSPVICEQLNESSTVSNEVTQLVYAVQAQQLTQSLTVNVSGDGTQSVDVIVAEQKSQTQTITLEEVASIKAVTCEQLAQAVNTNVSAINEANAITAEQLSQSITVSVDESSGIFVSVVHTEQLSQSILADINADSIINAIITQQLTQTSTQHINVDITLDAVICEQLTHAELITIIEQNISQQLSIDIDQITIEILTPTHEIEMLTPTYTIEHL